MIITVKYFGMIAEKLDKSSEEWDLEQNLSLADFRSLIVAKYSVLTKITFKIALNKKLSLEDTIIKEGAEIALLPPFAGG